MKIKSDSRTKLLFAQLNRTLELGSFMRGLDIDYSQLRMSSSITRNESGKISAFSGVFYPGTRKSAAPFCLGFYDDEKTGLDQMAMASHRSVASTIMAYLSLIDYLIGTGELEMPFHRYTNSLTCCGGHKQRVANVAEYRDFKIRAAKDLPYDLSIEVLNEIACGSKAAV